MTVDLQYTFSAVTDKIVEMFSMINHGEYYYKQILKSVWLKEPVIINKEHLKHLGDIIKPITNEQLKFCINNAVYKFLNENTACGFADWARNNGRLTWHLG